MSKNFLILICCMVIGLMSFPAMAISATQKSSISNNCEKIKDNLRNVQKLDSRTRVFFGSHYETILSKFVKPLNLRLVENDMSNSNLIDNQIELAAAKEKYSADFVSYQQDLEDLISMDCAAEPNEFYEKLVTVRTKRAKMVSDLSKMKDLTMKNTQLVTKLKEGL